MNVSTSLSQWVDRSMAVRVFPALGQLTTYRRGWLKPDVLAGLSVAAVALPAAIAYPAIADLPVEAGLYAAIFPAVGYALFGPSRRLMVGPDTGTTIVLAAALMQIGVAGATDRAMAAAALALITGALCILAGILRFGFIANFLSRPVLVGFLAGVAVSLIIGQFRRMTSVSIESDGLLRPIIELVSKADAIHLQTAATGIIMLLVLRVLRGIAPRFPGPLVAIFLGMIAAYVLRLPDNGVVVVGAVSAALPSPALPWPGGVPLDQLVLAALGIVLVSFGSGIITARSFGMKNHYEVDGNKELIGFGAANVTAGLLGGFPVSGSDSRTAVNDAVGGRTQLAGVVSAAALLGAILFLGNLFAWLPTAVLGAILVSAAIDLIDLRAFAALWRMSLIEFLLAVLTALGVVVFGVLTGVALAVGATLAHLLWQASKPRDALLGRRTGLDGLYKLHSYPDARAIPGLMIYLVEAGLVFFNADYVKTRILEIVRAAAAPIDWFVLDASAVNHIDATAAGVLEDLRAELASRDIALAIAGMHSLPRQMIERSGLADRVGPHMLFESAEAAAIAFEVRHVAASG